MFPLDLVDRTDEEIERLVEVRDGSFTTDAFSASSGQCPLCAESDRSRHESELTRCANRRHRGSERAVAANSVLDHSHDDVELSGKLGDDGVR